MSFIIRNMTTDHLNTVMGWAKDEGWNPGIYDTPALYQADPHGFFIALLNDEPIASISAVNYHNQFAFIGLYIVKPEFRGQGYGIAVWNHAHKYLGNMPIGLDGVVDQQNNYKKSGYVYDSANYRYTGPGLDSEEMHPALEVFKPHMLDEIIAYEASGLFPAPRREFLQNWLNLPFSQTLIYRQHQKITGYGTIRKATIGYRIGGFFADSQEIANTLLTGFRRFIGPKENFYWDIPQDSTAYQLAKQLNFIVCFETARMYKNVPPKLTRNRVYGITSLELG